MGTIPRKFTKIWPHSETSSPLGSEMIWHRIIPFPNLKVCPKKYHTSAVTTPNWLNRSLVFVLLFRLVLFSCGFPSLLSVAVINTTANSNWELEKGWFGVYFCCSPSLRQAKLEADTKAGNHGGKVFTGWLLMILGLLCYITHGYLPRGGIPHGGQSPPILIINQENDPQTCLSHRPGWWRQFHSWGSFLDDSTYVKLTKTHQQSGLGIFCCRFQFVLFILRKWKFHSLVLAILEFTV